MTWVHRSERILHSRYRLPASDSRRLLKLSACAASSASLSFGQRYGTAAVDDACAAALDMGVQEYRFVRRYLERCPQAPLSLQQSIP